MTKDSTSSKLGLSEPELVIIGASQERIPSISDALIVLQEMFYDALHYIWEKGIKDHLRRKTTGHTINFSPIVKSVVGGSYPKDPVEGFGIKDRRKTSAN